MINRPLQPGDYIQTLWCSDGPGIVLVTEETVTDEDGELCWVVKLLGNTVYNDLLYHDHKKLLPQLRILSHAEVLKAKLLGWI